MITQDTTLDSDLIDCPGDGVVIGASGITLDLAGHLIDGAGGPFTSARGVDNRGGHDGVTVTDGTIHDFFFAVTTRRAQGGEITRLDTLDDINLEDSPDFLVEHNATGLVNVVGSSHRLVIARSDITGRIFVSGGFPPVPPPCCPDIPTGSPEFLVVDRNIVTTPFGQGIVINSAPAATVTRNRVIATDPGEFGVGIGVAGGASIGTVVERNTVTGSRVGIEVKSARNVVVARNSVSDNVVDGIYSVNSPDVLIDRNTAVRNGDDGIDLDSAPGTISNNTANFNADLGIEAVPGVTDGGGNKAHGNGNPAQCVNVSCK